MYLIFFEYFKNDFFNFYSLYFMKDIEKFREDLEKNFLNN